MVNSEYCDQAGWLKNCYLCFTSGTLEDCAYMLSTDNCAVSLDLNESSDTDYSCEGTLVGNSSRIFFSFDCDNCNDIWFSRDLSGCGYCIGCVNLRNKYYYIFNKPYTKEEYLEKIKEFDFGSYRLVQELSKKAQEFTDAFPRKFMHGYQNVNVSGDLIEDSKNVLHSYSAQKGENNKYIQTVNKATDSYDFTNFGYVSSNIYESVTCGLSIYKLKFCWECWNECLEVEYSAFCPSSSYLFGCVGLRQKKYCILNKQYSKEDFEKLRPKIIQHMNEMPYVSQRANSKEQIVYKYGEFFPPEFSPFAYNETVANDYFPLSEKETLDRGYAWREPERREYKTTIAASQLSDHIRQTPDSILQEIIACASCQRAFRIIPMELKFYRDMNIPLPRTCPECRLQKRLRLLNAPKFYHRTCQCAGQKSENGVYQNTAEHFHKTTPCPNEFETSYAPGKPEIVYCESCYNNEVI